MLANELTMSQQRCPFCGNAAGPKSGATVRLCMWCKGALILREDGNGWQPHTTFINSVEKSEQHYINGSFNG